MIIEVPFNQEKLLSLRCRENKGERSQIQPEKIVGMCNENMDYHPPEIC